MAIVEMIKLKMLGLNSQKDKILDSFFKSKLVQLKKVENLDNTTFAIDKQSLENYENYKNRLKIAIEYISNYFYENKISYSNDIDLQIEQFELKSKSRSGVISKTKIQNQLEKLEKIIDKTSEIDKEMRAKENLIKKLLAYTSIKEKFSDFRKTKFASFLLGTFPLQNVTFLQEFIASHDDLASFEINGNEVIKVYTHNSILEDLEKKLYELGFVKCQFNFDENASSLITNLKKQIEMLKVEKEKLLNNIKSYKDCLNDFKVCYDYLNFCEEKINADNLVASTQSCFFLEAYLPKYEKEKIERVIKKSGVDVEFEFVKLSKNETPPTLLKNNSIVKPFEFITNMYSPPNYYEIDINFLVTFFFSVFFGFVIADMGYGLLLLIIGAILYFNSKKYTSFKSLMGIISIGGLFSILFGYLFGSFFGITNDIWNLIPVAVFPNPSKDVITMLGICLAFGVVQIMVSLLLKGILLIRQKNYVEAFFSGFIWEVFFIGLFIFALDFAGVIYNYQNLGLILMVFSILISFFGLLFFGSGLTRLSKSFGALYGIINIFSDILSYARLFGLMLSGAIISSIVNDLSTPFFDNISTIFIGVIILLIGHTFNLAMGVLSAYIHIARLQYIEFFSRFYTGEGELFSPFGWSFNYVNLKNENKN